MNEKQLNVVTFIDANSENNPDKLALCDMETQFSFQAVREKS